MSLTTEINLQKLAVYFLVDMSGSMSQENRLNQSKEVGVSLARCLAEIDDDGDIHFVTFGGRVKEYGPMNVTQIEEYYATAAPNGGTPMAKAIDIIEDDLIKRLEGSEAAHQLVVVVTDGEPNDQKPVVQAIQRIAKHVTMDSQIAFQFIQVGTDKGAKKFLDFLDNDISNIIKSKNGKSIDIIDTLHFTDAEEMETVDLILHAFND